MAGSRIVRAFRETSQENKVGCSIEEPGVRKRQKTESSHFSEQIGVAKPVREGNQGTESGSPVLAIPTLENRFQVDFRTLSVHHPQLQPWFVTGTDVYDFSEPEAVVAMSKALLLQFYSIDAVFLPGRLVPRVFNRVLYLNWLKRLLDDTGCSDICGLDIGTGHSLIYPMLGHSLYGWKFIATDIDPASLLVAAENIRVNHLSPSVSLVDRSATPDVLFSDIVASSRVTFTMCNPPFYATYEQLVGKYFSRKTHSMSIPLIKASYSELVHPDGGEVGFVTKMIAESVKSRSLVKWYTTLLGQFESVSQVLANLYTAGITNSTVSELSGSSSQSLGKTRRWIVAWSFGVDRPRIAAAQLKKLKGTGIDPAHLPVKTLETVKITTEMGIVQLGERVDLMLLGSVGYEMEIKDDEVLLSFNEGIWTRAYRRKMARLEADEIVKRQKLEDEMPWKYVFSIYLDPHDTLIVWWKRGDDTKIFNSFQGWLRKNFNDVTMCPK